MNLINYFWWFKDAVPKHICDEIVRFGLQKKDQMALTMQDGILIGIFLKLVSLPNITKINIMVGTVIVGKALTINQTIPLLMVK